MDIFTQCLPINFISSNQNLVQPLQRILSTCSHGVAIAAVCISTLDLLCAVLCFLTCLTSLLAVLHVLLCQAHEDASKQEAVSAWEEERRVSR
jgi:hypothetical protein